MSLLWLMLLVSVAALGVPAAAVAASGLAETTAVVSEAAGGGSAAASPVTEPAAPVAQAAAETTTPVADAAAPVAQSVAETTAPDAVAAAPVAQSVAETTTPVAAVPVAQSVAETTAPIRTVTETAAPVVQLVADGTSPVSTGADTAAPVVRTVTDVAAPVTRSATGTPAPGAVAVPSDRLEVTLPSVAAVPAGAGSPEGASRRPALTPDASRAPVTRRLPAGGGALNPSTALAVGAFDGALGDLPRASASAGTPAGSDAGRRIPGSPGAPPGLPASDTPVSVPAPGITLILVFGALVGMLLFGAPALWRRFDGPTAPRRSIVFVSLLERPG